MSVRQNEKGQWIVSYRKASFKTQKRFLPDEEQQARAFDQEQIEAWQRLQLEKEQKRQERERQKQEQKLERQREREREWELEREKRKSWDP